MLLCNCCLKCVCQLGNLHMWKNTRVRNKETSWILLRSSKMLQPGFLIVSEGNHSSVIKLQGYAPTRPCLGGLLGSSSTGVGKLEAAPWGCHSGRSTFLSITPKPASCLACKLFAACASACSVCMPGSGYMLWFFSGRKCKRVYIL